MSNREIPSLSHAVDRLTETWVDITPWELVKIENDNNSQETGFYKIKLDDDFNPKAPHKPILHGTTLFNMIVFQILASSIYYANNLLHEKYQHYSELNFSYEEIRRRLVLTDIQLKFSKPIFDDEIKIETKLTKTVDKFEKSKLIFISYDFSVNEGLQTGTGHGCINFRDNLI